MPKFKNGECYKYLAEKVREVYPLEGLSESGKVFVGFVKWLTYIILCRSVFSPVDNMELIFNESAVLNMNEPHTLKYEL